MEKDEMRPIYEFTEGFNKLQSQITKIKTKSRDKSKAFEDFWTELLIGAASGEPINQDFAGYLLKSGVNNLLPENFTLGMKWQILAGANGNWSTISRLMMFLNYAIDQLVYVDDLKQILERNKLDADSYTYIMGQLLCEGIVDELGITLDQLVKEEIVEEEYTDSQMRIFAKARDSAIPKVLKYLRS